MEYEELLKKAKSNLPQKNQGSRFEIPKPVITHIGKQTFIKNFSEISKILRRDQKHFAKYLSKELATPSSIKGQELVLQAKIAAYMIEQRINDYVKDFVLCHECGKPDTEIIEEKQFSVIKCEACGARRSFRA